MTTAIFKHIDTSAQPAGTKPWSKVDADATSFKQLDHRRSVENLRGREAEFTTDNAGFAVLLDEQPSSEKAFADDAAVRGAYYREVEDLLRRRLPGVVRKVAIFDHTIRHHHPDAPRAPVQQVHVDQTARAAEVRVRRHLPAAEADELLLRGGRFQIVNVWRPIGNPASDFPLAVIDWRSTRPEDFVPVDLLYPKRADSVLDGQNNDDDDDNDNDDDDDDDDRGKEVRPDESRWYSTEGYEVRGETLAIAANPGHKFYYEKDMTPDEVILLKCYDSFGEGQPRGRKGVAVGTPHTAFVDPQTPADAPPRQSIEVRCLVFYE